MASKKKAKARKTATERQMDKLLAAPDHTRKNDVELRKYRERKARERAQEEQLAASKLKEMPSDEDILADLIRVAEDPVTNPVWHKWRTLSQKRYRNYGHYPLEIVTKRYGQFEHAKQVAGLAEQPGTRVFKAARTQRSIAEHTGRYLQRYVRPYVVERDRYRELTEPYVMLSISDTHSTFLDPFTWQCFLSAVRDLKPDAVLFNGDTLEGAEISRHPKIPGWSVDLQTEFDFQREMVRQVRAVGHEGDFFINGGNHGIDRLAWYVTQVAPALTSLRDMRIDRLMGLDEHDVRLFQGGTVMSPAGTEEDEQGFLMFGFYRPHHGTKLGQNPAAEELKAIGYSGQSGHVHRAQLAFGCTERDKGLSWMCTPMGCTERAARAYIKAPNKGWQMGFGYACLYPDGDVHQYPVLTDRGRCSVEGFVYERTDLPDPDVSELWLPDLPLPE